MIWSYHDPAAEAVAYVNDSSAADETDNIWERCPKSQDENLVTDVNIMVLKSQTKNFGFEKTVGMHYQCRTFHISNDIAVTKAIKQ